MAGTSEDDTVRMKKNVLSWFGHVERMSDERLAKKIYDVKISCEKGSERPRLTFENTVPKVLEDGVHPHPQRACIKELMTVDEAKEVETVAFSAHYIYCNASCLKYL